MGMSNERAAMIASQLHAPQIGSMYNASQGLLQGINSFVNQQKEEGKRKSEAQANQYVANLLGKGDIKSIQQAEPMLAYASEPMQRQAQALLGSLQADRTYGLQDNEMALKGQELANVYEHQKANELLQQKQLDQAAYQFKNLSAAQKAQLGMEAQRIGLSAQELLLRKNQAEEAKKSFQLIPQMQKVYDTKGKVVGETPMYTRFNQYTGEMQQLGQGSKTLPPLK